MTKKKYKRYIPEFKRHVLKCASEDGVTERSYARSWGSVHVSFAVGEISIGFWVTKLFRARVKVGTQELTKLDQRELAKVKQERDHLRDAAVFFAKEAEMRYRCIDRRSQPISGEYDVPLA